MHGGGDTAEESGAEERSQCGAHLKGETVYIGGGRAEGCAVSHEKLTRKHNPECTCELLPRRQDGTSVAMCCIITGFVLLAAVFAFAAGKSVRA